MKPPAFWSERASSSPAAWMQGILAPLSALYAWAGARRIARARPAPVPAAVICIGNLTLGGSGKTPVAFAALQRLAALGLNAQGLSRGYRGRLKGPVCVDVARHTAADVGDEPLLLAQAAPVWVSRDRAAGAAAAVGRRAEALVMDDGHQNPALMKDISIVVIDASAGWGSGKVFPAGPLREPVAAGLARADAVIAMTAGPDDEPDWRALGLDALDKPVLRAWLAPAAAPPEGPVLAFAGIGRPGKFFDALNRAGAQIAATQEFGDHHRYRPAELRSLKQRAAALGATPVTTEKDWVRLPASARGDFTAWPVRAIFAEPERFDALLLQAMDAAAARR